MKKFAFILMLAGILMTACSSDKNDEPDMPTDGTSFPICIYKINGDYSKFVFTDVSSDRSKIHFIIEPGRVGNGPKELSDGFYVGCGNPNVAFLNWTYEEFNALPRTPSVDEMLQRIIPEAKITLIYEMPFTYLTYPDPERAYQVCDSLIKAGLPGCKLIYKLEE